MNQWIIQVYAIAMILSVGIISNAGTQEKLELDKLVGQQAELSEWAYAYRVDLSVQRQPEAYLVPRRLDRLDRVYRPVSLLPLQEEFKKPQLLPAPSGILTSALLWEGRVQIDRVELHWPKNGASIPPLDSVEVRVYPSPYGWFGWQWDRPITGKPNVSEDGSTWVYTDLHTDKLILPPGPYGLCQGMGNWNDVDMIAVFIKPNGEAKDQNANGQASYVVPEILAYGPEQWKRIDLEIEWGFKKGTEKANFDGRVEGFFGLVGKVSPLDGDTNTTMEGVNKWKSHASSGSRRGITLSLLYIEPTIEYIDGLPKFPYGHPRDTRITVWTQSGSFTFLVRDLEKGPIFAIEHGFFVTQAGHGKTAQSFATELAKSNPKSIRELTREHREATWEEAMQEISLPMLPSGTKLPPYKQVADPPMQVNVPEARWTDAWRMGVSKMEKGELSYMALALEAPRPIHVMDVVGLHDTAVKWLDSFLQRPGSMADGDFNDGSGNFCTGKLFHETAIYTKSPVYDTYELIHNGGTGRILFDLAEHYFLTGDKQWFKKNQWRLQAAAEWIIRQKDLYLQNAPNRADLWVAGLHPPQHISDIACFQSEWKWYVNIDGWYYQGLRRFAQAMAEVDSSNAGRYLEESEQYRQALKKAVDRAMTLAPVMRVRNGTYRSYIPPILYIRGPSIGQVNQIAMTDDDWPLELVDSAGIPDANDPRLDGHLDVCEDVLALKTTYLYGGNRFQFLTEKRKVSGRAAAEDWFWGGVSPQLGYSYLANVFLRRDEVSSFLRQWVNNYAAFVMPTPEYSFLEHFMGHVNTAQMEAFKKGDYLGYANSHGLAYFMEQFRSLLVWEDGNDLWLAKATPRHWLEQGNKISVKNAPTYFGILAYEIVSDVDNGKITATIEIPNRNPIKSVIVRFRHPKATPIKSVTVNGKPWKKFNSDKEIIELGGLTGKLNIIARY